MKALVFGARPDPDEARPAPSDELEEKVAALPFGLHGVDDAHPIHPDWVVTRPILPGCAAPMPSWCSGTSYDGDIDNPIPAFSSLPRVPGHEVGGRGGVTGPGGPGRGGGPTGGPQPLAELRRPVGLSPGQPGPFRLVPPDGSRVLRPLPSTSTLPSN